MSCEDQGWMELAGDLVQQRALVFVVLNIGLWYRTVVSLVN